MKPLTRLETVGGTLMKREEEDLFGAAIFVSKISFVPRHARRARPCSLANWRRGQVLV